MRMNKAVTAHEMWNEYVKINSSAGQYQAWSFGGLTPDGPNELADIVLKGIKTATASAYPLYIIENSPFPLVGDYSVILNTVNEAVCIIKTTKVYVMPFSRVTAEHAYKEGESDRSLSYWKESHREFFTMELKKSGREFTEDMPVVCEEFEVMYPTDLLDVDIRLVAPDMTFKNEYLSMIEEWRASGEELVPWTLSFDTSDFYGLIKKLEDFSRGLGLPEGFVPSSTYWLVNNRNRVLGAIDIRHVLTEKLLFRGGHIGYGIRPSERRKGYATKMLSFALERCSFLGIPRVLITCAKDNIGSAKTIIKNRGVLDSEDAENGEIFQRYWIDL